MATKHSILFESLKAEILSGKYAGSLSFPSETAIARRFDVSRITVQRALRDLEREGLIVKIPRKGVAVVSEERRARTVELAFPEAIDEKEAAAILRATQAAAQRFGFVVSRIKRGKREVKK